MNQSIQPTSQSLTTFWHACLFVAGFSLVFVIGWGGAATLLGGVFYLYKPVIAQLGGLIVIGFGLSTLGLFRLPWLFYQDTRPQWSGMKSGGSWLSSPLMGMIFAAGWSPCIGTTLGAILTLGMSQDGAGQAMLLTSGYAFGMGIPFLLLALGVNRAVRFVQRFRRHIRTIQMINGLLLVAIGLILLLGKMTLISIWAQQNGWYFDLPLSGGTVPSYLVAAAAGLLSFFSPCVFPLVPAYLGYISSKTGYLQPEPTHLAT